MNFRVVPISNPEMPSDLESVSNFAANIKTLSDYVSVELQCSQIEDTVQWANQIENSVVEVSFSSNGWLAMDFLRIPTFTMDSLLKRESTGPTPPKRILNIIIPDSGNELWQKVSIGVCCMIPIRWGSFDERDPDQVHLRERLLRDESSQQDGIHRHLVLTPGQKGEYQWSLRETGLSDIEDFTLWALDEDYYELLASYAVERMESANLQMLMENRHLFKPEHFVAECINPFNP